MNDLLDAYEECRAGDREAGFAWIYHKYQRLVAYILVHNYGVNGSDVDDISQMVWQSAAGGLERLNLNPAAGKAESTTGPAPVNSTAVKGSHTAEEVEIAGRIFKAWLGVICKRKVIDFSRRNKRTPQPYEADQLTGLLEQSTTSDAGFDLNELLQSLTGDKRQIVVMRSHGYTFKNIAKKMGSTLSSVYARYREAIDELREDDNENDADADNGQPGRA